MTLKRYVTIVICLMAVLRLSAQQLWSPQQAFIDVNSIRMAVRNNGIFGNDLETGGSGLYFPAHLEPGDSLLRAVIYTAGITLAGMLDGDIRTASTQFSSEYQPGPILPDGSAADPSDERWQVHVFNRGDAVPQWLVEQGCPSAVMGDQMLFTVYNDLGPHNAVYTKRPIGIEVQQTVWAYSEPAELANTVFLRYRIINKNVEGRSLESAYVGIFSDPNLGDNKDDAAGCEPGRDMIYTYNGAVTDDQYGYGPPAVGVSVLNSVAQHEPEIPGLSSFAVYINGCFEGAGDPTIRTAEGAVEVYWSLRGFRNYGLPWENPITGETSKFPLSGDPVRGTGWRWRHVAPPTDLRMLMGSGPFDLKPHEPVEYTVAVVVGHATPYGGDNLSSIDDLRVRRDQAVAFYNAGFEWPDVLPTVEVSVAPSDSALHLSWDSAAESFNSAGYAFEGYNVWLCDNARWENPERTATFDKINSIQNLYDLCLDRVSCSYIYRPVAKGSDSGLEHGCSISWHPFTLERLHTGQTFYVAVTAYAVNAQGLVIESEPVITEAVPQPVPAGSRAELASIGVFPNPYFGIKANRPYITFSGLPADDCVITIFSVSGRQMAKIRHDNGSSLERFVVKGKLGSGLYLAHIKTAYGSKVLKFAVVETR